MTDIALIVLGSSVAAIIGIALGVMLPALAMGKAGLMKISHYLQIYY